MINIIFTVYDKKARAYLPPFYLHNDSMAVRTFGDCVNDPKHQFGAHPEDYSLYSLGTFDDSTAKFDMLLELNLLVTGITLQDNTDDNQIPLKGVTL